LLLFASCSKPDDPVSYGRYLIENRDLTLLADSLPVASTTLILEVTQASGGQILPSEFLHTLVITRTDSLGNTTQVYSGVHDADWQSTATSENHDDLRLVVQ